MSKANPITPISWVYDRVLLFKLAKQRDESGQAGKTGKGKPFELTYIDIEQNNADVIEIYAREVEAARKKMPKPTKRKKP